MKTGNQKNIAAWLRGLCLGFVVLALTALGSSQNVVLVTITGTVADPDGAVVPDARVSAQNKDTGQIINGVTGSDGKFSLSLPAGVYTIKVSSPGFRPSTLEEFAATAAASASINVALQVAPPVQVDSVGSEDAVPTPISVSGHAFLVANQPEAPGYGLYSYLLLRAPANSEEKERDLAVIKAFVELLGEVSALEGSGFQKPQINITYLPVKVDPPHGSLLTAEWVLSNYNFERARFLLSRLNQDAPAGPYVISSLKPVSKAGAAPPHFLWQDMSHVPPSVAAAWEKEFERCAKRRDFWAPDTRNTALLHLRDLVSNAGSAWEATNGAVGSLKGQLASWLTWK